MHQLHIAAEKSTSFNLTVCSYWNEKERKNGLEKYFSDPVSLFGSVSFSWSAECCCAVKWPRQGSFKPKQLIQVYWHRTKHRQIRALWQCKARELWRHDRTRNGVSLAFLIIFTALLRCSGRIYLLSTDFNKSCISSGTRQNKCSFRVSTDSILACELRKSEYGSMCMCVCWFGLLVALGLRVYQIPQSELRDDTKNNPHFRLFYLLCACLWFVPTGDSKNMVAVFLLGGGRKTGDISVCFVGTLSPELLMLLYNLHKIPWKAWRRFEAGDRLYILAADSVLMLVTIAKSDRVLR